MGMSDTENKKKKQKQKAKLFKKDRAYYRMLPPRELVHLVNWGERGPELCVVLAERLEELLEDQDNWVDWHRFGMEENNPDD
jgi:hypothetical protein